MKSTFRSLFSVALLLFTAVFLTSCFEVREEFDIKSDGSGSYKFVLDMSQIGAMMKGMQESLPDSAKQEDPTSQLGNVNGVKFESVNEIKGISNAVEINDKDNYIFGGQFDFANIEALNKALSLISKDSTTGDMPPGIYSFSKGTFARKWHEQYFVDKVFGNRDENVGMGGGAEMEQILSKVQYKCIIRTGGKIKKYAKNKVKMTSPTEVVYEYQLFDMKKNVEDLKFFVKFK
ncbi:MAG: hypothetical protein EAZ57_07595 [Cytophagales bacterium]|nr:MAG: hypothetical protein EAZ67_08680 [Cytophagales bacterium]TAF60401.1 MAG: hypothetical protein EAZ57_07595 [Cytophagales bacterium]